MNENDKAIDPHNPSAPPIAPEAPQSASELAPSEPAGPAKVVAAVATGSAARKRDDRQCQCCASPLGEPVHLEHTKRIICTTCLGFMARWIIELEQPNAEVSNVPPAQK